MLRFTQGECLKPKTQTRLTDRVPLVTTYNPCTTYIAEIANRHLDFLKSKGRLAKIFNQRPLVAYRKPRSLRDMLVSSRFQKYLENNPVNGCKPCKKPRCSWCKYIKTTDKFKGTHCEREYKIFHSVDCQSSWVNYSTFLYKGIILSRIIVLTIMDVTNQKHNYLIKGPRV